MANFAEEFLGLARRLLPPHQFERISKRAESASGLRVYVRKAVFICAEPSQLELIRGRALCGPAGAAFEKHYLGPLGLKRADVDIVFAKTTRKPAAGELWIALGQAAKDRAVFVLPHPDVVRKQRSHEELTRKLAAVAEMLCKNEAKKHDVKIRKADTTQQIVYGVVLDPYQVDAHEDWIPPAEVEKTAHDYVATSRYVSLDHERPSAGSQLVESFVESYPSPEDRMKAFAGEPHTITQRKFGDDVINSGAWVIGVKLDAADWAGYKDGAYDAFSIEGFGERQAVSEVKMPEFKIAAPAAA